MRGFHPRGGTSLGSRPPDVNGNTALRPKRGVAGDESPGSEGSGAGGGGPPPSDPEERAEGERSGGRRPPAERAGGRRLGYGRTRREYAPRR
jgi:hypothetical protein